MALPFTSVRRSVPNGTAWAPTPLSLCATTCGGVPPAKSFRVAYPSLLKFLIRQLRIAYHYVSYLNPENNENLLSGGSNGA